MMTAIREGERWSLYKMLLKQDDTDGRIERGILTEKGMGQGHFYAEKEGYNLVVMTPTRKIIHKNLDPDCLEGLFQGAGLSVVNLSDDDVPSVKTPWIAA